MPKIVKQLTNLQVQNAKPREKVYYLADGNGLRIAVKPSGVKTWLFNYTKPYTKKRTDLTIGTYPQTSISDARAKAAEYRRYLSENTDPQTAIKEKELNQTKEQLNTFALVSAEWLAYRAKLGKEQLNYSEKTRIDTERRVKSAVELIGDIPFAKITLKHGLEILEPYRMSGMTTELRKRYLVLKAIAEYAEKFGYWQKNEWRYLGDDLPTPNKNKHFAAINYRDLPELLLSLRKSRSHYGVLLAILWGLLNATRAGETVSARFENIVRNDHLLPDRLIWEITVRKGGKGERLHLVPLSKQAETLFTIIRRHSGKGWLFPSITAGKDQPINSQTPNDVIKNLEKGKYKGIMTNHGIRSLFSSYLNDNRLELGLDAEIIEVCLSHLNSDDIRNAYNRAEYLPYRLKAFQAWADYVEQCANGLFAEIIPDKN